MRCAGRPGIMPIPTGPGASAISTTPHLPRSACAAAMSGSPYSTSMSITATARKAMFYRPCRCADRVDPRRSRAIIYPVLLGLGERDRAGQGEGFNLNIPLPVGSGDDAWLGALDKALTRIADYAPGALVVRSGSMPMRPIPSRAEP